MIQFAAPSVQAGEGKQALPLAVFAQYLGGGDTSALYTALVREQKLATSISVSYDPISKGPGVFRISAIPAPGVTLAELERGISRTLEFKELEVRAAA